MGRWGFNNLKDVLEVLAIPLAAAGAAMLFGWYQNDTQLDATAEKAREDALQAYFDQMSQLVVVGKDDTGIRDLRDSEPDSAERDLARTRTLAVLRRMDEEHADNKKNADRKRYVVRFLSEANLIDRDPPDDPDKERFNDKAAVELYSAYLDRANLSRVPLQRTNMRGTNMRYADLSETNFSGADLAEADLTGANLTGATLDDADLTGATLDGITLTGATLDRTNLTGAKGLTEEKLGEQAKSYSETTMPE